jgi:hypothetical protein
MRTDMEVNKICFATICLVLVNMTWRVVFWYLSAVVGALSVGRAVLILNIQWVFNRPPNRRRTLFQGGAW